MMNPNVGWLFVASLTTACISDDGSKDDDDGADTGAALEEAPDPGTEYSRAGCTVSVETDIDADESVDRSQVQTWHELLAPDGGLMEISYHEESEGYIYDSTKEWDTDLGCLVALDIVEVVEGVESLRRYRYECDAQNWRTSRTYEALRDGEWVLLERQSWDREYNAEGNRIRELSYLERLVDDPGEEWFLGEWIWEEGNYIQYDAYTGEGLTPYYTSTYTYQGDLMTSEVLVLGEYFEGSVGDLYRTTEWSYDSDGNTLRQRTDYSESGDVLEETWEYDPYARTTDYTLYDSDANDDLVVETDWDPELYRKTFRTSTNNTKPSLTWEATYGYDGGWPWTVLIEQRYELDDNPPADYRYEYTCGAPDNADAARVQPWLQQRVERRGPRLDEARVGTR